MMDRVKIQIDLVDNQIAWVGHVEKGPDGKDIYVVDREGMSREEIVAAFPPHWNSKQQGMDFNRTELIKAIIAEAYDEAQSGYERDRKNVRGFWYERLLYTLRTVMGDDSGQDSIDTTLNRVWGDLVESGRVTYAGMNIYSKKSKEYHIAVKEHSPYATSVVLVEKESFFEPLHDLADIYGISFVATGGQNSRCAAMEYVEQLRRKGIDLSQTFTVYSFCDFDPEGWDIPLKFIEHLQIKITNPVQLVRLGVLKEQISDSILHYQASPYAPANAKSARARKGAQTKYENFIAEAGGIFMPGTDTPARVELDIYTGEQIRERIIEGLARHLDGFQYQVNKLKEEIEKGFHYAHDSALKSLMDEWDWKQDPNPRLAEIGDEIDKLKREMAKRTAEEDDDLGDLHIQKVEIERERQERIRKLEERFEREQALLKQRYERYAEEVEARIANRRIPLYERTGELENIKLEKTTDLRSQISALRREESDIDDIEHANWKRQRGLYEDEIFQQFANAGDVIISIERNGGWRNWLAEVEIEEVNLEEAGRERETIAWEPTWSDKTNIREWLKLTLKTSVEMEGDDD